MNERIYTGVHNILIGMQIFQRAKFLGGIPPLGRAIAQVVLNSTTLPFLKVLISAPIPVFVKQLGRLKNFY